MAKNIEEIQTEEKKEDYVYPDNAVEKVDEVKAVDEAEATGDAVYRYYCPACSGTAFTAESKEQFENECRSCHASLERDENNYIQL